MKQEIKVSMVGLMLYFALSTVLFADSPEGTRRKGPGLKELKAVLQLSDAQVNQLKEQFKKIESPPPKRPEIRADHFKRMDETIKTVLTPDQKNKYEAFKAKKKAERQAHMRAQMVFKLQDELDL